MKNLLIVCLSLIVMLEAKAQNISGQVITKTAVHHDHDHDSENQYAGLPGANLVWAGTTVGTSADSEGKFRLRRSDKTNLLVVSYTGYRSDTVEITENETDIQIILQSDAELDEIVISRKSKGEFYSVMDPVSTQIISKEGLKKLPCCDLSESFENNASVDVNFTDAVSGAKQIKMLGLAGTYTQILRENIPDVRGLSSNYGLTYLPGSWMESVQISKGASTVTKGYESVTGQINTELKKPESSERLYVNLYGNSELRHEANITAAHRFNEHLSTGLLLHGSRLNNAVDHNGDGFADMPLYEKWSGINRWKYHSESGLESQIGIRFLSESRRGGQMGYLEDDQPGAYRIGINTNQYELFGKLGFPFPGAEHGSVGSVWSWSVHDQNSVFGTYNYSGVQKSFYTNIMYNTQVFNEKHTMNTGFSFVYDDYTESLNDDSYLRNEQVPGIFAEYNYKLDDKFNLIAGVRTDFHNLYGTFFTPRMHLRYQFNEDFIIRASGGRGFRTPNIIAENIGVLASSRSFIIEEKILPEVAWNYGASVSLFFDVIVKQALTVNFDFYRTDFENQLIADIDANPHQIRFYNLRGESYSNSFQTDIGFQPNGRFSVNAAFRYTDVKVTMHDELIDKPMVNKFKGLLTGSWTSRNDKWAVDVTNQFTGNSPLPDLSANPEAYRLPEESKAFYTLHLQITRKFNRLEIYAGGENLTDYRQENPIIAADDPFGEYFDASMIWGPLVGRMYFAGLRYTLE